MTQNQKEAQEKSGSTDVPDAVKEASEESFPASDAPSWTPTTGEKDNTEEVDPNEGCTTSFLMEERGEIGGICKEPPDPKEQYVQPNKEKKRAAKDNETSYSATGLKDA